MTWRHPRLGVAALREKPREDQPSWYWDGYHAALDEAEEAVAVIRDDLADRGYPQKPEWAVRLLAQMDRMHKQVGR